MRVLRAGFLPVSTLILLVAAFIVPLPMYVERPGRVVPLDACVAIDDPAATGVNGDFLLTTVNVLEATVADAVAAAVEGDATLVARRNVVPEGVSTDAFFREQRKVFRSTADVAAAVGLDAAGQQVTITGEGAVLLHVTQGSPAAGALAQGDVVVSVDGRPITTDLELRDAILAADPGQALSVGVQRDGREITVEVAPAEVDGRPQLGVVPQTLNQRVALPAEVDVRTGPVGGPSAGLMVALTVYDKALPDVDLAAGRTVAGTGAIDAGGAVTQVGSVAMKVLAAHRRGAEIFLAPRGNAAAARAAVPAGAGMDIVVVDTFDDARRALLDSARAGARGPKNRTKCPYAAHS